MPKIDGNMEFVSVSRMPVEPRYHRFEMEREKDEGILEFHTRLLNAVLTFRSTKVITSLIDYNFCMMILEDDENA